MSLTSELNQKRLSDHLRDVVRSGISGRDLADLPEKPFRVIYAGVLQPPHRQQASGDFDASAIGIDFKLQRAKHVAISCDVKFALYYPIFPPFRDLLGNTFDSATPSQIVNITPWYRRYNVNLQSLPCSLEDRALEASEANEIIKEAVKQAAVSMKADAHYWTIASGSAQIDVATNQIDTPEKYEQFIAKRATDSCEELPLWRLQLVADVVEHSSEPQLQVKVMLANVTNRPEDIFKRLNDWNVYDANFVIIMPDAIIVPYEYLLAPQDYRLTPELIARGINCSVAPVPGIKYALATETLPLYEQPYYRTRSEHDKGFDRLAKSNYLTALTEIEDAMQSYASIWADHLTNDRSRMSDDEFKACESDLSKFKDEIERFHLGLDCLRRDPLLQRAFQLMNECFSILAQRSGGRLVAWRLFQIGFIVSQLPGIAARKKQENEEFARRLSDAHQSVGVLWFPTGGGKTEAYLGLIAIALLYDRLRGKLRGVNTWMRFPLRMLSLQQLERMSRVIAVLNELRSRNTDISVGDEFALGFFIGRGASPNKISKADAEQFAKDPARRAKQRLLMKCPHCASRVEVEWRPETWRLAHVCSNTDCFSNVDKSRGDARGSLPLYVVDDEIYRYLPSVLVGTIDKLASAMLRRDVANLTSGVEVRCPTHGYLIYGKCIERTCDHKASEYRRLPVSVDPSPTFLVQDEFHLLRDELGVFAGHYEGLLQVVLGQMGSLPPKILAATATIEAYDNQAFQIYLKDAIRYPESGWENGESFYATSTPAVQRRSYIGVLCHTRSVEDVTVRIESLYLREIRRLKADPTECARILGLEPSDTLGAASALRLYDFMLAYVTKKTHAGSIKDKQRVVEEYLARFGYGRVECSTLTGDNSSEEIGETIERVERELDEVDETRLEMLVATSLISHGVDLERINCMIVTGMPSHYAEYVQSSSRCARSHPGNIFVCFKSRDAREASQYQSFPAMHEHMERLIEPIAVNRFASFAPRKTVPGMLVGYLLSYASPKLYRERKIGGALDEMTTLQIALGLKGTAKGTTSGALEGGSIAGALCEAIGVDRVRPPALASDIQRLNMSVIATVDANIDKIGRSLDQWVSETLDCLTSFRDIDEGVQFSTLDSMELLMRLEG